MRQHALSSSAKVGSEHVHREFGAKEEKIQSRDRKQYPGCNHFSHLFLGSFNVSQVSMSSSVGPSIAVLHQYGRPGPSPPQ